MKLVHKTIYNKEFDKSFDETLTIKEAGFYLFEIKASANSWWQNITAGRIFSNKDSLTVQINSKDVFNPSKKKKLFSNDLWNGNVLKGNDQTVYIFTRLEQGRASLSFRVKGNPFLKGVNVYLVTDPLITLENLTPSKRDRIPWLVFLALEGTIFNSISLTAQAGVFGGDDADLQIHIDGENQRNPDKGTHRDWYWCGYTLRGSSKIFDKSFHQNKPRRFDIVADGSPTIERFSLTLSTSAQALTGRIALHQDIEKTDFVRLREGPQTVTQEIAQLKNGEEVQILEERVIGEWMHARSYVWHKVIWNDKIGYIHSSFVEIYGQGRAVVVRKIIEQSQALNIDQDVLLALAGCESLYKPYATSRAFEDKDKEGNPIAAKGIFQLTESAIQQLQKNVGKYHYIVKDVFDVAQNIHAGIRYAAWLYDTYYRDTPQSTEKLIAAYNAGQGYIPAKGRLTYDHIPSQGKRVCTREEKKESMEDWRHDSSAFSCSAFLGARSLQH